MAGYNPPYAGVYIEYLDTNGPKPQWLPQAALSSVTKLNHTASHTLLTQTFLNPTVSPISSAKYTFPLYESCAIVAFRCHVGGRLIEGIVKEKEDASATFQAAVDRNEPASLLEQHTADVFTTSIGNVPAGGTVKVEIEYIMELKHDAELDGLRFTIPTSIAPRYGTLPIGLGKQDDSRAVTARNMNISVQVTMSSSIQSVQSPSHPISLYFGGHTTSTPDDAFNPQLALATLGQTTTELGRDFILLIKCSSLSSPVALLEVHPTIPNSKALMVTLVPKFNLAESTMPEVVFIVDRSGSMSARVEPLKSSLSVFLKSLPLGVNFNICSFGTHHSFLWDRSRSYSKETFAEAQKYCNSIRADFGGTEILPPIQSTIQRRLLGLNLEILILTDGEVWNSEVLFKYVEKETEKGDVRLFSLGIGRDVSHALVDGLARVGRGFSQIVSDAGEGMESKVARMLRGGLSAHVVNYRLEWEGKPSAEQWANLGPSSSLALFSLFDSHANTDSPVSFSDSPDFTTPSVSQAPYKIQPLFPFSRSTVYLIISSDAQPPSHVRLRGTTPEGDELELEIEVQNALPAQGETIHQLAARKILQELKDGTSYVHGAVDKERQPALLAKWVKMEGVRVGLRYGVASHWTSFVAVEREEVVEVEMEVEKEMEMEEEGHQGVMDVSPSTQSALDDVVAAERANNDGNDNGMYRPSPGGPLAAHFEPQVAGGPGGGAAVPAVVMMAHVAPPLMPYPTHSNALEADSSDSLNSNGDSFFSGYEGSIYEESIQSVPALSPKLSPPLAFTGKYEGIESGAGQRKRSFWSALKGPAKMPKSHLPGFSSANSVQYFSHSPSEGPAPPTRRSTRKGASPRLPAFAQIDLAQPNSVQSPSSLLPHSQSGPTSQQSYPQTYPESNLAEPLYYDDMSFAYDQTFSQSYAVDLPFYVQEYPESYTPPFNAAFPNSASSSAASALSDPELFSSSSSKKMGSSTTDIDILYSPSRALAPAGLSADTGAQPLSSRTKGLIDLQTFEGSFVLDLALATLLGVSLSDLEERLISSALFWSPEGEKIWATVLAIKLFETQLAGEQNVWQLVVEKAKLWLQLLAGVSSEDIAQLEKMAEEVLGA